MKTFIRIQCLLLVLLTGSSCFKSQELQPTFDGRSQDLRSTKVVAALDEAIPNGTNLIWCASFQSAWKQLQDLAGSPIEFETESASAIALNRADDPRPWVPVDSLYVASGWAQEGITAKILRELEMKFPGKKPPGFGGIAENSFVVYSYIEANIRFSLPYQQNTRPLAFVDRNGNSVNVTSFGILRSDRPESRKLRRQAKVLFFRESANHEEREFAIDLCSDSTNSQVVVARLLRQPASIGAAVEWVEQKIAEPKQQGEDANGGLVESLSPGDALLVPDFCWSISHFFSDLQGSVFRNAKLKGHSLDIAQQDIKFRLNRMGVELKSETMMAVEGVFTDFVFDGPFLVYMKRRDAKMPYFVMWVENAELMRPWQSAQR